MLVHNATYEGSYSKVEDCLPTTLPEYAFIGRSNVGKSSLVNMVVGQKAIAHVSKRPGKTASINYFKVNNAWFLVDLPGYGYAVASKKQRRAWSEMIRNFLAKREALACAMVLIDSNIPPQAIDLEFLRQLGEDHVPFALVFTKCDRTGSVRREELRQEFNEAILKEWEYLPFSVETSAIKGTGREGLLDFIEKTNELIL